MIGHNTQMDCHRSLALQIKVEKMANFDKIGIREGQSISDLAIYLTRTQLIELYQQIGFYLQDDPRVD